MKSEEQIYFGDIHNHSNISYAHGDLDDAIENARQALDFCSVTGHAHWPDMPEPNERIGYIVDFHVKGFEKLKRNWAWVLETMKAAERPGEFFVLPSFEIHSNRDGDRAVVYRDTTGKLLYPDDIEHLGRLIREMNGAGRPVFALPHHIGYHQGARGINWRTFDAEVSPVVEIYSMHGCAETTENGLPFLHSMGPADWHSTIQYGLEQGHIFGVVGNTDHHSAHPGSYGHGKTGVWAAELSRESIWEAYMRRRTVAMTGDRVRLDYRLGESVMGEVREAGPSGPLHVQLEGGAAVDYVDVVHNNRTIGRISPPEMRTARNEHELARAYSGRSRVRTKVHLEVGWGPRGVETEWEVEFGIESGTIVEVEPRFRGPEVLSPVQKESTEGRACFSKWRRRDERSVRFETITYGNPTSTTAGSQGVCLDIEAPVDGTVWARLNGVYTETTVERLMAGGKSGHLRHEIDSQAWLFHRAPEPWELFWETTLDDLIPSLEPGDFLYLRVRQQNNQWAWGSPIFVR